MRLSRQGRRLGLTFLLGLVVLAACSTDPEGPPRSAPAAPPLEVESSLDVAATCDDVGSENDWDDTVCETGGNGACQGQGVATSDCEHCCAAPPPPSCGALAKQKGWPSFACETVDNDACLGLGEASSDCDVCCEAPSTPPTCAALAADWGFDQAICEAGGNGACQGQGPATSDCAHCCDVAGMEDPDLIDEALTDGDPSNDPPDPASVRDDDPSDADFAVLDEPGAPGTPDDPEEPEDPALPKIIPQPPPPPPPSQYCGVVASNNGWPNPACEFNGNNACNGQGPETVDCDHCCSGTGAPVTVKGCGDGVCGAGETCSSCAKDCGECLRVAGYNASGVTTKAQLYKVSKAMAAQKPAVVGVQNVTKAQLKFLSKRLKTPKGRFAVVKKDGGKKVGHGLLSSYSLKRFKARRLPGNLEVLAVAGVRTPLGEFSFGSTALTEAKAKAAATRVTQLLSDGHALLAASLGGEQGSGAFDVIDQKLPDSWSSQWGAGKTTSQSRRDFVFRGKSWEAPVIGKVVGPRSDSLHGAIVEKYHLTRMGQTCTTPGSLAEVADLADVHVGNTMYGGMPIARPDHAAMVVAQFDTITFEDHLAYIAPSLKDDAGHETCARDPSYHFDRIDPVIPFVRAHGRRLRFHPLLWDPSEYAPGKTPTFIVPRWQVCMADDPAQRATMGAVMKDYITQVIHHLQAQGGTDEYIVLNEAIRNGNGQPRNNIFRYSIPDAGVKFRYVGDAFRAARAADGKAKLIYNDYNCEFYDQEVAEKKPSELTAEEKKRKLKNTKSNGVYQLVKELAHQGVPIDGVGFQMHYRVDRPGYGEKAWAFDARNFRANLRRYAKIKHKSGKVGVDVYITEFDLQASVEQAGFPDPPAARLTDEMRREIFAQILGVCSTEPNCKGVSFWGATDLNKWVIGAFGGAQDPLPAPTAGSQLFNAAAQPNPQTFCGAVRGFVQGACESCMIWRSNPQGEVPCGDAIYQCQ